MAYWLEHLTCDGKVPGSSPLRSADFFYFFFPSPWSKFCADPYFGICSTPELLPKAQVVGYS